MTSIGHIFKSISILALVKYRFIAINNIAVRQQKQVVCRWRKALRKLHQPFKNHHIDQFPGAYIALPMAQHHHAIGLGHAAQDTRAL